MKNAPTFLCLTKCAMCCCCWSCKAGQRRKLGTVQLRNKKEEEISACRLLVSLLYRLESYMDTSEESCFLQDMLMGNTLHVLIKLHERLERFSSQPPAPFHKNAGGLAHELMAELHSLESKPEIVELLSVLSKTHFQVLLLMHDTVAQKDYEPKLPPLPELPGYDENIKDSVRIIRLVKSKEPLGATIKRDKSSGDIIVARIMRGGAADRSGLIHEGDKLREVNGVLLEDKKPEELLPILAQSDGAVTFKVIPGPKTELEAENTAIVVRALFDYDPREDPAIPCRDAGLAFRRGDVLQIVCQDDDAWWQARRHGDANFRARLIPSRQLQERRVALQRPEALFPPRGEWKPGADNTEDADYGAISGIHIAGLRRSFRLSRKDRKSRETHARWHKPEGRGDAAVHTYLEVVPYVRGEGETYRLVLLVAPSRVGVSELKRKLLLYDPDHFGVPVPHTTRERRRKEREGVEYHFVSRRTFEKDILNHKFIEYGLHDDNYYGISLDSVRRVLAESKVCLLNVEPHVVKTLCTPEFKPYVVFVKPPAVQQLRLSRRKAKVLSGPDESTTTMRVFLERRLCVRAGVVKEGTIPEHRFRGAAKNAAHCFLTDGSNAEETDFEDMVFTAQVMEKKYGHLFEKIIVNEDLAEAFTELRVALEKLENEVNWIPKTWSQS